jgi:Predicted CoA-binding protein
MSGLEGSGWRHNLIEDLEGVRHVLAATKRVAVLGIRSEQHRARPAFYVPQYLASAGLHGDSGASVRSAPR